MPGGGKLLRMEKHTHLVNGRVRDNWFAVEKFAANGWRFTTADNQYYYLEKM